MEFFQNQTEEKLVFGVRRDVFLDVMLENNPGLKEHDLISSEIRAYYNWLDKLVLRRAFIDREVDLADVDEYIDKFRQEHPNFQKLPEALFDAELDLFVALERHVDTVD
jgi:hypothetical protein